MDQPKIVMISASLAEKSRSRIAVEMLQKHIHAQDIQTDVIDLRDYDLGLYPKSKGMPVVDELTQRFHEADGWIFASPVYNWEVNAALRNFLHYVLTKSERRYRPFVIVLAASDPESFLAGDAIARTILYEEYAVQVGPAVLVTKHTVDRETGLIADVAIKSLRSAADALIAYTTASLAISNSLKS